MTSDVLLILFVPFLLVMAAVTVWLRLSARRIDRLQAEAAVEKAAATSVQTAEAATADRWEEGFRKVRASWQVTPEAMIGEAIALTEKRNPNPASKADKDIYRHRSSGMFVKQASARPSGQRAKVYTKRPLKERQG